MAKYRLTSPDGVEFDVEAPDTASEQEVMAYAQANWKPKAAPKPDEYTPTGSFLENAAAGAGKAVVDTGRGLKQIYAGVADFVAPRQRTTEDLITGRDPSRSAEIQEEIDEAKKYDKALMETGGGITGNVAGHVATVAIPGGALGKLSAAPKIAAMGRALVTPQSYAAAAAAGGAMGFVQPVATGESRTANTGMGALAGLGGQYLGNKIGDALTRAKQGATNAAAQNAVRDQTAAAARDAGYVIPPTQTNPTIVNRALEGVSGKIMTGQAASLKNQGITDDLIREEFGLAPDVPLTKQTFETIRNQAGQVYDQLKKVGTFTADQQYGTEIQALGAEARQLAQEFPELANNQIDNLVAALNKPNLTSQGAVNLLKRLRFDGSKNSFNQEPERAALGRAQMEAARAVEDLIERNLSQGQNAGLLDSFRAARTTIAKAHSVESALNEATGNVNAGVLAKGLKSGKPMSGNLRKVAETARAFPTATRETTSSMPGLSPLDVGFAIGTQNPLMLAGRPGARAAILSGPYQRSMGVPSYSAANMDPARIRQIQELAQLMARAGAGGSLVNFE